MGISVLFQWLTRPEMAILLVITGLLSYFLGNLNGAILISRRFLHDDVREHGSGNGGLTNFQRTYKGTKKGRVLTLGVIATDMLKVVLSVWASVLLFTAAMPFDEIPVFVKFWAGLWCVVGHVFPVTLHFHGGKGILAGGTLALIIDWRMAVFAWGFFLLGVLLTRWVSLGSVMAATAFGVSGALCFPVPSVAIPSLLAGALIVWKHKANIKRLLRREEPKLSFHKDKDKEGSS